MNRLMMGVMMQRLQQHRQCLLLRSHLQYRQTLLQSKSSNLSRSLSLR